MFTVCWIAFYAVFKNNPAWCEQNGEAAQTLEQPRHLSTRIPSWLLVFDFRFGSNLPSHYSGKCHENPSDMRRFKTEAAQHRCGTKIDPK